MSPLHVTPVILLCRASIYTSDQDADFGALFCTFNVDGDPTRAECHFRDIQGRVPDRFKLKNRVKVGNG